MKKLLFIVLLSLFVVSCATTRKTEPDNEVLVVDQVSRLGNGQCEYYIYTTTGEYRGVMKERCGLYAVGDTVKRRNNS
jgi:hypothetical protein